MLNDWSAPFLDPKTHYFYLRLLAVLRCSALLVSEYDQGTHFDQPDCVRILSFQNILSDLEFIMKVVVLDV